MLQIMNQSPKEEKEKEQQAMINAIVNNSIRYLSKECYALFKSRLPHGCELLRSVLSDELYLETSSLSIRHTTETNYSLERIVDYFIRIMDRRIGRLLKPCPDKFIVYVLDHAGVHSFSTCESMIKFVTSANEHIIVLGNIITNFERRISVMYLSEKKSENKSGYYTSITSTVLVEV